MASAHVALYSTVRLNNRNPQASRANAGSATSRAVRCGLAPPGCCGRGTAGVISTNGGPAGASTLPAYGWLDRLTATSTSSPAPRRTNDTTRSGPEDVTHTVSPRRSAGWLARSAIIDR